MNLIKSDYNIFQLTKNQGGQYRYDSYKKKNHLCICFSPQEKSKAKITITDIVHRAQTSRTTFYHYFSGLEDLNNECIDNAIDDINHILNKNLLFNIPILTEMLDYIKTNSCYFQSLKTPAKFR